MLLLLNSRSWATSLLLILIPRCLFSGEQGRTFCPAVSKTCLNILLALSWARCACFCARTANVACLGDTLFALWSPHTHCFVALRLHFGVKRAITVLGTLCRCRTALARLGDINLHSSSHCMWASYFWRSCAGLHWPGQVTRSSDVEEQISIVALSWSPNVEEDISLEAQTSTDGDNQAAVLSTRGHMESTCHASRPYLTLLESSPKRAMSSNARCALKGHAVSSEALRTVIFS
jgi:hypothetical protein